MYPEARMIAPMLIWKLPSGKEGKLSEVCESGEYFAQLKVDGYFYQFEKTTNYSYLFSRTISKVTGYYSEKLANVPHIKEALDRLPAETTLIGEIYVPGGTSKDVTSIMGCLPEKAIERQQKQGLIHFYVHDIIQLAGQDLTNTGAAQRYLTLCDLWDSMDFKDFDFLELAQSFDTDIEARLSQILSSGGEGIVLKKCDAPYTPGKRPAWHTIKCKQMDTIDMICTDFIPPTKLYTGKELESWCYNIDQDGIRLEGNYTELKELGFNPVPVTKPYYYGWPGAICIGYYNSEGKLVETGTVASGLTDEDRKGIKENPELYKNSVVALRCMSIDKKNKTLRHPAFVTWRPDKNAEDCNESAVFS